MRVNACVLALCAVLAGCRAPSTPSNPPTAVTITPADDLLLVKAALTFKAVGTFADGARPVEARWLTDNAAVATVSAEGAVTGVSAGSTTLVATAEGQTAWRVLRVVPDYSGSWSGQYRITACSADDPQTCGRTYPVGRASAIALTLTRARDVVSGTLTIDEASTPTLTYAGPVSGAIAVAGFLVLQGNVPGRSADGSTTRGPTLSDWSTNVDAAGTSMTGRFTQIFLASLSGALPTRVQASIVMSRTSR